MFAPENDDVPLRDTMGDRFMCALSGFLVKLERLPKRARADLSKSAELHANRHTTRMKIRGSVVS